MFLPYDGVLQLHHVQASLCADYKRARIEGRRFQPPDKQPKTITQSEP